MKTRFVQILFMLFVVASFTGYEANAAGYTLNKYEITPVDNSDSENAEKAWSLSYGQETPVVIHLVNSTKGKEYVVRSEFFEVTYLLNDKGLGAKFTRNAVQEVAPYMTKTVINADELQKQHLISQNKLSEKEVLEIIASYLPDLLNENYKHLLM